MIKRHWFYGEIMHLVVTEDLAVLESAIAKHGLDGLFLLCDATNAKTLCKASGLSSSRCIPIQSYSKEMILELYECEEFVASKPKKSKPKSKPKKVEETGLEDAF